MALTDSAQEWVKIAVAVLVVAITLGEDDPPDGLVFSLQHCPFIYFPIKILSPLRRYFI